MSADRTHLLIPIHVDALGVSGNESDIDRAPFKYGTVSAAPDYSLLTKSYRIGADLRDPLKERKLEKGIHLHFRLPAAVAHGDFNREPAFPRIPNRWLVQRYYKQADIIHVKAWLVSSDKEAKDQKSPVVLLVSPVAGATSPFSFRPTGVANLIWDVDKPAGNYDYRQDNAGAELELTAVTGGDAGFSAHYPACRSILGFYDDLAKLPADPKLKLSYLVTGWYSSVAEDPWNVLVSDVAGKAWAQLSEEKKAGIKSWMDERGCSINFSNKVLPSGILCHGLIEGVGRAGDASGPRNSPDPFRNFEDPGAHWVDLGNTSAEALGARVAKLRVKADQDEKEYERHFNLLEDLVTALQVGLFSQGSGAAEIDAELHRQGFAAVSGGKIWEIQQAAVAPPANTSPSPPVPLPPLPADLQNQLDALNKLEEDCCRRESLLRDYRWELYALWHRWTDAKARNSKKLLERLPPAIEALKTLILDYEAELKQSRQKRDSVKTEIQRRLPGLSGASEVAIKFSLLEQPVAPFYTPKDPVLLLTGPAAQARGTRPRPDAVTVRVTGEELQSFRDGRDEGSDQTLDANDAASTVPTAYFASIPPWATRLFKEALLMQAAGTMSPDGNSLQYPEPNIGGLPDDFSRFRWRHSPWIPLYLYWSVLWKADDPDAQLNLKWTLNHGEEESQFRRNTDLIPPVDLALPAKPQEAEYRGLSFVGSPLFNLQFARVQGENKGELLALMKQIDEILGSRPNAMISQALGGLHDAFIMRRDGDQLPPLDYGRWNDKEKKRHLYLDPVQEVLGKDFHPDSSPMTPSGGPSAVTPPFSPLRGGVLQLQDLWVIDAFGQRTRIEQGGPAASCLSGRLSIGDPLAFRLAPRFCRPMRLEFTGISADAATADPVCGWVLQNRFDQNLVLYAADGRPVGILQKRFATKGETLFYWVPVPGAHGSGEKVDGIQNPFLRDFANFVLSRNFEVGRKFDELIKKAVEATEQRVPEDNPLLSVLLGRPLALVRAQLRFEMDGLPALDQKLSWTESSTPGELSEILKNSLKTSAPPPPNRFMKMKTGGVENVRWPVRLGDRRSAIDGLVGFFEGNAGSRPFYSSWGFDLGKEYEGLVTTQDLELDCNTKLQVTLLMDPQARVHVTSGVLPRTFLELTAAQLKGLKQVREVFFQTAPVLGTSTTPHVPTPSDDYGQWSWAYRPNVTGWAEDPSMVSAAELAGPSVGWPTLTEGWLKLKTEPVLIRSLWMKAPVERPMEKGNVTLAWSLHSPDTIDTVELFQLRSDGTKESKQKWSKPSLGSEWTSYVEANTTFRLKATNSAGWEDYQDLEIQTKG